MRQFQKQSTRPLTAESYRRSGERARNIAAKIHWYGTLNNPSTAQRTVLTRAIKDLAAHSARLLERHKEQS